MGLCHCIEPLYRPLVEPVKYLGAMLLVIWAPGGYGRPYRACKDVFNMGSAKEYYVRRSSSTTKASADEEKELFYLSADIPFDDRPNLLARVDDLDLGLLRAHLKRTGSALHERSLSMGVEELARDMQLVSGPAEDERPLNVALLMFAENPRK